MFDVLGRPIAAIGLSFVTETLPEDTDPIVDQVKAAAAEVTAKLR